MGVIWMHNRYLIVSLIMIFILFIICSSKITIAQSNITSNDGIDWLSNPELDTEADITEFAGQNSVYLQLPPDNSRFGTNQNLILKQEAHFFIKFIDHTATDDIYQSIAGRLYIRMPRYLDPDFRESLLKSIINTYLSVTHRWERLGFKVPRGFIFIWIISNLDKMRQEFATDPGTMAFALPCRYIVIPYEVISDQMKYDLESRVFFENGNSNELQDSIARYLKKNFESNLAHELTHVLVFTKIGFRRISDLDKWFHEGIAIWMSRQKEVMLANEYQEYKRQFDFIRMKYGNQLFQRFIKDSIRQSVDFSLKRNLQFVYYGVLMQETKRWFAGIKMMETILSILAVLCFGLSVYRWVRSQPSYLYYLNLLFCWILFGWKYGFYNLWTNSNVGSAMLNLLAGMLMLSIVLLDIRHAYFSCRLHHEIAKAQVSLNLAAAQAAGYFSVELANVQNMMQLAGINQKQWRNQAGINWAKEAAKTAQLITKAVENATEKQVEMFSKGEEH